MSAYQAFQILDEGLIFGLVAFGIYIAFVWLRFPDLTPDGSFALGAGVFALSVRRGYSPFVALFMALIAAAIAGMCTALLNRIVRIPAVVAGLLIASALYSLNWLILGKPNQFIEPQSTLVGDVTGVLGARNLAVWLFAIICLVSIMITAFSRTMWGLRTRAIGENGLLARDLGLSETSYTVFGLALANALVGLGGALFAQRSFSADINMGVGITIAGLAGLLLGLLFVGRRRRISITLVFILMGAIAYKIVFFISLELGVPAEAFRLISSSVLVAVFLAVSRTAVGLLKGLKWT